MCRYLAVLCVIIALCSVVSAPAAAANADKIVVAVMPFTESDLGDSWYGWGVSEGITNLVTDELISTNKVAVVERNRINEILAEQDMGAAGLLRDDTASQIGKLLGARVMIMGTVTTFSEQQTAGVGIGIFRIGGKQAKVALTARLIDTETGVGLAAVKGEGTKTGASFSMDYYKGLSFDGEQFRASSLGQAASAAVKDLVANLVAAIEKADLQISKAEAKVATSGTILAVAGNGNQTGTQIIVNIGAKHGMTVNTMLNINHMMTVPGLQQPMPILIGTARIINVQQDASVAEITSVTQEVKQGDTVSPQ